MVCTAPGFRKSACPTILQKHVLTPCSFSSALYFFLGTSKELSTGPTSILGLLTAEVVADLSTEGYAPEKIASAIAFMVGVYSLAVGLLKLGFLVSQRSLTWLMNISLTMSVARIRQCTSSGRLDQRSCPRHSSRSGWRTCRTIN